MKTWWLIASSWHQFLSEFHLSHIVQVGKLSTGDSLDMSPQDEASIIANDATIKDMEVTFQLCLSFVGLLKLPWIVAFIPSHAQLNR